MTDASGRPTEAVIDLAAVRHNVACVRERVPGRGVIAVVKADAYGHGAVECGRALVAAGCERLAVLSLEEAVPLREAGIAAPILLLGGVHDDREAREALAHDATVVLHDRADVKRLANAAARAGAPARVHLEVDTGMRRMGVPPGEAAALLRELAKHPQLALEGAFTHLACADEPDAAPSLEQLSRFREVLHEAAVPLPMVHAWSSGAVLSGGAGGPHEEAFAKALPEANAVRPGLMLYGVAPARALVGVAPLRPVMRFVTRVVALRSVAPGEAVGYGATWRPSRTTRVATLAAGYADGVPRAFGNRASVWLAGARRPVVGRVSMDYITVEVGDAAVAPGDEAVLFGPELLAEEAAEWADSIGYEMLVRVGARVPRRTLAKAAI